MLKKVNIDIMVNSLLKKIKFLIITYPFLNKKLKNPKNITDLPMLNKLETGENLIGMNIVMNLYPQMMKL
jgi:hypothetical protein